MLYHVKTTMWRKLLYHEKTMEERVIPLGNQRHIGEETVAQWENN